MHEFFALIGLVVFIVAVTCLFIYALMYVWPMDTTYTSEQVHMAFGPKWRIRFRGWTLGNTFFGFISRTPISKEN